MEPEPKMPFETKDPQQSKELLDAGDWTYIDVRTTEEFALGHPPGAYNVPFLVRDPVTMQMTPNPDFVAVMAAHFPPERSYVLGCAMGGRSMHACGALGQMDFGSLVSMDGGFTGRRDPHGKTVQEGWHGLGYPSDTEAQPGHTYEELHANT